MQKRFINYFLYSLVSGVFLMYAMDANAQKKRSGKSSTSKITTACQVCLNNFSPETLTFTTNAAKCPAILAKCGGGGSSSKCESIINDCFNTNCQEQGSCSDEIANRNLAFGCLKSNGALYPYNCSSYISGLASTLASSVNAQMNREERDYQAQLKAQDAKIQADKSAAEKASADAKVRVAKEQADAQTRQKALEEENKLKMQTQKAQLEQQAKDAEIARQKKDVLDAKNSKPNVKYNNILSEAKRDIATARTYTNRLLTLTGMKKTTEKQVKGSMMSFPPQIVSIQSISMYGSDPKTKSILAGSKYKDGGNFRCTKDTNESLVRNELNNAYNVLKKGKDKLANSISELEAINADDEATGRISEDKITTLYQVQNKMTEAINEIEAEVGTLLTSCETRCNGMSSMMQSGSSSSKIEFDENGLIKETASSQGGDYKCEELDNADMSLAGMMGSGGKIDMKSAMGGIGSKVMDLTRRVTVAVLNSDKKLEEVEIASQTGKFGTEGGSDYSNINSCVQYMVLDIGSYTSCATNVLSQQFTQRDIAERNNADTSIVDYQLNKSIKQVLDLLNSGNYAKYLSNASVKCTGDDKDTSVSIADCMTDGKCNNLSTLDDFRKCILGVTALLNEVKTNQKNPTGQRGFNITGINGQNVILNNGNLVMNVSDFAAQYLKMADPNCTIDSTATSTGLVDVQNTLVTCNGKSKTIQGLNNSGSMDD